MGSHVSCLKRSDKTNAELQGNPTSSEMLTQAFQDHRLLLQHHRDLLKQMIDPKGSLLMELLSRDVMDDRDRQWIKSERRETEMNARLIGWLMENDASTFSIFLESLRTCHQQHIANLLENKDGDRILTKDELQHVVSIEPLLAILLDTKVGLVDMLYSCGALSRTDFQRISARSTDFQINKKLLKVLMRGSDVMWQFFFEGLKETKQSHLLKYLDHGAILSAKVELSPHSCRHVIKERVVMDQINDITRHLHLAPVSQYVEDNRLVRRLVLMDVECVCVHVESYIVFYLYCPSSSALAQLWQMYLSGQLQGLIYNLFNVKSVKAGHAEFKVRISKVDYKTCKKRLDSSGHNSIMNLCLSDPSNTSQLTSIQKLSVALLDLILLKAVLMRLRTVSPRKANAYIDVSSVCSAWRTAVSRKDFTQRLKVFTTFR